MFQGYSDATVDFLWGIRFNNDRAWFAEHKEEYLQHLYRPTQELGREVYDKFHEKYPKLPLILHVSRIYRDARRLHGRGPYKDHLWLSLQPEAGTASQLPAFWFEVAPEGWGYGMGFWNATPTTMEAFRRESAADPRELEKLARKLEQQDVFTLQGREYARAKACPSALLQPWFNKKSIIIGCDRPWDDLVCSPDLADALVEGFAFLEPYYSYCARFCRNGLEDLK